MEGACDDDDDDDVGKLKSENKSLKICKRNRQPDFICSERFCFKVMSVGIRSLHIAFSIFKESFISQSNHILN